MLNGAEGENAESLSESPGYRSSGVEKATWPASAQNCLKCDIQ